MRREAARHHGRRREVLLEEPLASGDGVPDRLETLPERLDIHAAMRALPAAHREVLALRYAADMTQSAIAHALGTPEGTVKVRLHRARNHLRRALTT